MIEQAILDALLASQGNPYALATLALIELSLAQRLETPSQSQLHGLIDAWGQTLLGVKAAEIGRLKEQLKTAAHIGADGSPQMRE